MAETQSNETGSVTARQGPRAGNGGTQQDQNEPTSQSSQDRSLVRHESGGGRASPALSRSGSRQLARSRHPFTMMRQLSRDMDRLFDSFFGPSFGSDFWGSTGQDWDSPTLWSPQVDIQRRDDALVVRADLPGVRKEDVQIDVDDNVLVISGQRREEHEEGGPDKGYQAYERSYGSFYRSISLPQDVKAEDVKAEMRDGVLKVTVPLPENARRRRIQIQG